MQTCWEEVYLGFLHSASVLSCFSITQTTPRPPSHHPPRPLVPGTPLAALHMIAVLIYLQTRESRNVAYVAMTRAERVLYLSHIGPSEANSFFTEAKLPGDTVQEI